MQNGKSASIGDRVAFAIKKGNKLVWIEGKINKFLPSYTAKAMGVWKSKKSGRVLEIECDNGEIHYKKISTCKSPKEIKSLGTN